MALLALAHRDARAVPEPALHLRLLVVVMPARAPGAPSASLCAAKPWITTAVTDLSMQKYVSLPLAYCSENLRITSRFFAERCVRERRKGRNTRVSHDEAAVAARERARNENDAQVTSIVEPDVRRLGASGVTSGARARRGISKSGRRRDAGTRFARSGGGVMRTIRVDAQGGDSRLAGATDAPRAVARIALPRSSADEPVRGAVRLRRWTSQRTCRANGSVACVGDSRRGGGTTEVRDARARCDARGQPEKRRVIRFRHTPSSMTAKQKQMVHYAVDSMLSHDSALFSEI